MSEYILQDMLANEIAQKNKYYTVFKMHNDKEHASYTEQVDTLTEGKLSFFDFVKSEGSIYNKESKIAIVLPEKALEELYVFNKAKIQLNIPTSSQVSFISKDSLSDINYMIRENNHLCDVKLKGDNYSVFKDNKSHPSDADVFILLKNNPEKAELKQKKENKKKNSFKM